MNRMQMTMNTDCYYQKTRKGILSIKRSEGGTEDWEICLENKIIAKNYSSADEAALYASKKDFVTQDARRAFLGINVSADLRRWSVAPPEKKLQKSLISENFQCASRHWRRNS